MEHFDYVVIGAGIEGSWTAYQLLQDVPKPSVLLLDRFPLPHSRGSSHGQTRIIRHAYGESYHVAMMPKAYEEWRKLEKNTDTKLMITKPLLCVADKSGYDLLDNTSKCLKEEQAKGTNSISFKEMNCAELRENFPQANFKEGARGMVEYSAGILFADKCMATLQARFAALGGVIRDGFLVQKVQPGQKVQIHGNWQGKEVAVNASKVAICVGPWTKKYVEPLLNNIKLPLRTFKVPVFYWAIKENGRGAIDAIYKDRGIGDFWSIPEVEYKNMIKFGSNNILYEVDPDERDKATTKVAVPPELGEHIRKYFPGMEDTPSIIETCMYTCTPDETSIIDTIPGHENIAYACGFSGSGFKKAPCVGIMMKELLNKRNGPKQFSVEPFSLRRFL